MPEITAAATELTSQYSTQVAGDLERNLKEQERIAGDLEALQAQLAALQHDHTILVSIQQVVDTQATAAATQEVTAAPSGAGKRARNKKSAGPAPKQAAKKSTGKSSAASAPGPTLVTLVHQYLADQSEPRSAAEITTSLQQLHPERALKTTVVRTTLEGLVAKNRAQRTKQGSSVFYTAADAAEPAPATQSADQQPA